MNVPWKLSDYQLYTGKQSNPQKSWVINLDGDNFVFQMVGECN